MKSQLSLTHQSLDEPKLVAQSAGLAGVGAVCRFTGIVRSEEEGQTIAALDYEAFEPMARRQFELLFAELAKRWPDAKSVRLVHRLGRVPVSEASLWVEVTAPHRAEAFAACQWLIDEMKRVVPIWKRPIPAQGSSECSAASPSMAELRFDAGSATTINSRG